MVIVRKQLKIGEKLLKESLITETQLKEALEYQKKSKEKLGEALITLEYVTEEQILPILADHIGVKSIELNVEEIDTELLDLITEDFMRKNTVIPIKKIGKKLTLAMANPNDINVIDDVNMKTRLLVKPVLALEKSIMNTIHELHEKKNNAESEKINEILDEISSGDSDVGIELIETEVEDLSKGMGSDSAPIVRTVNAIVAGAIKAGASDIHIEPYEKYLRIRYRIDGVLAEVKKFPKKVAGPLVSRVKIMSELDIAEKRLPQDGRFRIRLGGKDIDFRVSCLPTVQGEKIVLRILDQDSLKLDMEDMGFEKEELEKLQKALGSPFGMILVTGPTGSGKSTTLYSALNRLNSPDVNISTAEDPVEFQVEGINQVHCKAEIGLDFASALRSFLRQDPDVIMVGEIRDKETAEISIKAALTGHLVLSTLHTNSAPATISRLINMGIEPFMISASLLLIEAQRLGRRICKHCKIEDPDAEAKLNSLGLVGSKELKYYKGEGCPKCNGTGYKGRVGFYEIMLIDDEIRELISSGATTEKITKTAIKNGMKTIRMQAIEKAKQGVTTLEEVLRVTLEG
ncbi:MAG: type IV-A pilus assembly ATPase PilB [Fusobacteriia bacterium 4572_132]|nr:MAG: type IV-A pilus assembly ATPase PilB [Fusobacteriia bacterium 4572_132]